MKIKYRYFFVSFYYCDFSTALAGEVGWLGNMEVETVDVFPSKSFLTKEVRIRFGLSEKDKIVLLSIQELCKRDFEDFKKS